MRARAFQFLHKVLVAACFLHVALPFGCSIQSPKHMTDGPTKQDQKNAKVHELQKPREDWTSFKRRVVSMDYLRPVASIKHPELYIYKEKRRLYVLDGKVLVRDYPIGLGEHPKGDKEKVGDGRTPEGTFFVCAKNPKSRFGKSVALSYPTLKHAQKALFAGLISSAQYRDISIALKHRQIPPWNTRLGGEIFVHGGGAHMDWTDGCVALYNSDMKELFKFAKVGTPVIIRP